MSSAIIQMLDILVEHRDRLAATSMREQFETNPARFDEMSVQLGDLVFDYSKNHIDDAALSDLLKLAEHAELADKRQAMFSGQKINTTENRAVLHTALRNRSGESVLVDGEDVIPEVDAELTRMEAFSEMVRNGSYKPSGKPITDVVNIGIGGSDLGPKMVVEALSPYADGPKCHFVSNVDGADLADTLEHLNAETTLFIVASKTFTTRETMTNAHSARKWVAAAVGDKVGEHFCALSTNLEETGKFGISDERTFGFWDWVGGRYSVWSAIGLSVMLAIGADRFDEFLDGALTADQHFQSAEFSGNIPVLMALLGVWHRNICGFAAHALLPYENRLASLPRWLQQLDMESNGKSVMLDGVSVSIDTGPIIFGEPGTNGQHAFYQLIHQGTEIIPCDFLVAAIGHEPELNEHHKILLANCLAQSEALMRGRTLKEAEGNPHRVFEGNRPSNTLLYRKLDPKTLGMLMAMYEHKIFVQGVLWNINSFDQWGVELGKELAGGIEKIMDADDNTGANNASTKGLLDAADKFR